MNIGKFAKFYVAVAGGLFTALESLYPSTLHWLPALSAGITAALVYLVPNGGTPPPVSPAVADQKALGTPFKQ